MNWIDFKTTPPTERTILAYVGNQVRDGNNYPGHIHLANLKYYGSIPEWVPSDAHISDPYCHVCGMDIDEKIVYWMPVPDPPDSSDE